MTEQNKLITNHNIRIVTLTTGERVLCIFGEVRDDTKKKNVVGYRMLYPYTLTLGEVNEDGNVPINYERWCPYSPIEEHRMSGEHIITVVYPENSILRNYVRRLNELGMKDENIFFEEETETEGEVNGNNGESTEAGE